MLLCCVVLCCVVLCCVVLCCVVLCCVNGIDCFLDDNYIFIFIPSFNSIISQALKGLKAVFITCFAFLIIYFLLWVFIGVIDVNVASLSFGAHEATVTIDSNNVTHINYKDTSVLTTACSGLTMVLIYFNYLQFLFLLPNSVIKLPRL